MIVQAHPGNEDSADSATSINLGVEHDGNELVLRGSHVASADGRNGTVQTSVLECDQPLTAVECGQAPTGYVAFTFKSLAAGDVVEVSTGQSIQVEVVISFTSG